MSEIARIRTRLLALRGKIWTALLLDGGARLSGVLLGAVALSFALDRVFKLEVAARAVLLLGGLGALGWVVWRFWMRRLGALPSEDPLAVAVEARHPELRDRLISALQLARVEDPERYGMSGQLIEDAIHDAIEPAGEIRFGEILASGRVFRTVLLGALAIGLLAAGAVADPESAGIWFRRNVLLQSVRWPQRTYLEVDPARFPGRVARIVRGEDLVVTALSTGELHPEKVTIFFEDSEGERGRATMKTDVATHTYRHEFKEIAFPITFHLEGGDEETDSYHIELMEPPEVVDLEVSVAFPAYAGRDPVTIDLATGDPEMLKGGSVTLRGRSTKPLERVHLLLGETEEAAVEATLEPGDAFEVTFSPEASVLAGLRLRDTDGLTNPSLAPRFLVRVVDDRAPRVRLQKEGIGTMVVPSAVFPYAVRIRDDVRAVSGRIAIKKTAGDREAPEPHVIDLPADRMGSDALDVRGRLELSTLDVSPGAFLSFVAHVKDNAEPEAHEGRSDPVTVKVVTLEEFFNEIERRQQEQRQRFEELIKKEKRLRDRFRDLRDDPPSDPTEMRVQLESQAQEQREIARRVRAIERAMAQILDEMINNRVDSEARIAELRSKLVRGLVNLRVTIMGNHAKSLDHASRRAAGIALSGDDGQGLDDGYGRVLQAMNAILAYMVKIETFTQIIEQVRRIVDLHGQVTEATRRKHEAVLKEIFDDPKGDDGGK